MRQIKVLVKNNIISDINNIKLMTNNKNTEHNLKAFLPLILVSVVLSLFIFTYFPVTLFMQSLFSDFTLSIMEKYYTVNSYYSMYYLALMIFVPISFVSSMFFTKDNETLLYLPIKNHKIFFSKLITVYIEVLLVSVLMFIFGLVPLGIAIRADIFYFIGTALYAPFLPIIPLFIGAVIGIPVVAISTLLKRKRILSIILITLFVICIGYLILSGNFFFFDFVSSLYFPESFANYINPVAEVFVLKKDVLMTLLIFLGVNILAIVLMFLTSGLLYRFSVSRYLENTVESIGKKALIQEAKVKTPSKALFVKELKIIVRSPMIFLFTIMLIVWPTIMEVLLSRANFIPNSFANDSYSLLIHNIFIVPGFCFLSQLSISAISREGSNFHIMQTMPIPIKEQLRIKFLVAMLPKVISIVGITVVLFVKSVFSIPIILLFVFYIFVLSLAITYKTLLDDLKRPRLGFDNHGQILFKNEKALLSLGLGAVIGIITLGMIVVLLIAYSNLILFFNYVLDLSFYINVIFVLVMFFMAIYPVGLLLFTRSSYLKNSERIFENIVS